jgi:hypothetical protein
MSPQRSQRDDVVGRKSVADPIRVFPKVAHGASGQPLTPMVDFDQRLITLFAAGRWHGHGSV